MNFTKQIDNQKDKSFKTYNSCSVRQGHDKVFYYNKLNSVRGNKDKDDGIDGS
jgi:hypothetical protein